jgi:hypothetical protein
MLVDRESRMEQELSKEMIALYGALGGAALTLFGQVITQLLSFLKEYQVARLNRGDKKIEREFEKSSQEKIELAMIFQKCLSSLGKYIQKANSVPGRERSFYEAELTEIQDSISQLMVKCIDRELEDNLLSLIQFPSETLAMHLRSQVLVIVEKHSGIGAQLIQPSNDKESPNVENFFTVELSTEFRKKHFESTGKILGKTTEIPFNPEFLSSEIRKLLVEVYFFRESFKLDTIQPLYVPNGPDIKKAKKAWEANFVPGEKNTQFIFDEWYEDYKRIEKSYRVSSEAAHS